jgi:thiamine-phosphate pyrophosphorylase
MDGFQYYLITDRNLYHQSLEEVAVRADEAGISYFQLREKDLSDVELLNLSKRIRARLKRPKFIVHGRIDIAVAADADGVHLQKNNIPVSVVRAAFPHLLIGYSAHSLEEMKFAEASGADYVFLSPVFSPRSKESFRNPLGIDTLNAWCPEIQIPVFALGGISADNLPAIRRSGCYGAAAISLYVANGEFTSEQVVEPC